ncbi:cytoplasmic tRNA 2-thiolation protein 2-A-like isoform X1 [Watersipora subatra]|uniref:cytoplasmic tRNA 2-thiolation protein 2-A-like isoform X1 n=1 Tax=Watersipora subatra TaxID=2589382 RepID=UPI00355B92B2
MCSTYEEGEILEPPREVPRVQKVCMKCKKNSPQLVIRVNDAFCRDCFLQHCTHKFRSAFGKSKIIRDGERVLIAFSGGPASSALLHLVMEGKSVRAQKKLRFLPGILYIDEGAALGSSRSCQQDDLEFIKEKLTISQYPYHIVKLEQLCDEIVGDRTPTERLNQLFHAAETATAKEQLLCTLRREIMIQVAKAEGYSKVIVADTSSRLSIAFLSNMAMGKGAHISYDTSLLDDRDSSVYIMRPLKDFTDKEVAMYNRFNGITAVTRLSFTTKAVAGSSINKLTEAFITGLQDQFPSTVSTIMRTSEKLMNSKQATDGDGETTCIEACSVCKAPLDTRVPKSSALMSVSHADMLCERRLQERGSESGSICRSPHPVSSLCYSCRGMLADMSNTEFLPSCLTSTNRMAMRSAIEDSLL